MPKPFAIPNISYNPFSIISSNICPASVGHAKSERIPIRLPGFPNRDHAGDGPMLTRNEIHRLIMAGDLKKVAEDIRHELFKSARESRNYVSPDLFLPDRVIGALDEHFEEEYAKAKDSVARAKLIDTFGLLYPNHRRLSRWYQSLDHVAIRRAADQERQDLWQAAHGPNDFMNAPVPPRKVSATDHRRAVVRRMIKSKADLRDPQKINALLDELIRLDIAYPRRRGAPRGGQVNSWAELKAKPPCHLEYKRKIQLFARDRYSHKRTPKRG